MPPSLIPETPTRSAGKKSCDFRCREASHGGRIQRTRHGAQNLTFSLALPNCLCGDEPHECSPNRPEEVPDYQTWGSEPRQLSLEITRGLSEDETHEWSHYSCRCGIHLNFQTMGRRSNWLYVGGQSAVSLTSRADGSCFALVPRGGNLFVQV